MTGESGRRYLVVSFVAATAVMILAAVPAVEYSRTYHQLAAYHFDSASYRWQAVDAFRELQSRGLGASVGRILRRKDALDQLLRLLVMPRSLTLRYGHLFVALPFLWLFLFLLSGYVLNRTGSPLLALLACTSILAFPLLYLPRLGLADDLPETTATWLLGTAVICWIRAEGLTRRRWAGACGLFLGLLAAQRTVAAVFAIMLFVPPVMVALLRRRAALRKVVAGLAAMLVPLGLLGVSLAVLQGASLYRYYSVLTYSYARFAEVLRFEFEISLMTAAPGILLILGAALTASLLWPPWGRGGEAVTALWFATALPIVVAAFSSLYLGFVWLWIGLLALLPASLMRAGPGSRRRVALVLLVTATVASVAVAHVGVAREPVPMAGMELRRRFDALIAALPPEPRALRVQLLIDDSELLFLNQAFFDAGRRGWYKGPALVSQHDSFYNAQFGSQSPEEVAQALTRAMEGRAAAPIASRVGSGWFGSADESPDTWVVGYCDPAGIEKEASFLADGMTRACPIVRLLNEHVARSKAWQPQRRLDIPQVGCVTVYRHVPVQDER
jgi:hypothetical protein